MLDTLFSKILTAAAEIRACAEAGRYPASAVRAVEAAHSEAFTRLSDDELRSETLHDWYMLLYRVYRGCVNAQHRYEGDPVSAACKLRLELKRLAPLAEIARREREAVFA